MGKIANLGHDTRLLINLMILLLKGLALSIGNAIHNSYVNLLRRKSPLPKFELMLSTYETMRERLMDSLNEIEHKNRILEESREKLMSSRNFLQAIIDSLDVDLMVLDNELRVVQANNRLRNKHSGQEVIGHYCYEVSRGSTHPCETSSCICPIGEVKKTNQAVRVVQTYRPDPTNVSKNNYFEVSISPLFDSHNNIIQFVELIRDITESKELEKRILEANCHLLVLNAISNTASQSLSLDVILNGALDKTLEFLDAKIGEILLFDEKLEAPSFSVYRGLLEDSPPEVISLELARKVIEKGETLVVDDSSFDLTFSRDLKTLVCAPLKTKNKVVGVLTIARHTSWRYSQPEVQLLTSIGHQLGIIVENAQLYHELQVKEESRTELLRRIILAQEDERHRVARELHDVTSQTLATLGVGIEALAATPRSNENEITSKMAKMRNLLTVTSKDIHRLIYDLRPSLLDDLGLSAALRSCAHNSLDAAGVEMHMEVAGQERRLPPEIEIAIFRIAQEAIANISRHAHAESAYINLEFRDKSIAIQVEDDGTGFDFSQGFSGRSGSGVGLIGMKERAELFGGRIKHRY